MKVGAKRWQRMASSAPPSRNTAPHMSAARIGPIPLNIGARRWPRRDNIKRQRRSLKRPLRTRRNGVRCICTGETHSTSSAITQGLWNIIARRRDLRFPIPTSRQWLAMLMRGHDSPPPAVAASKLCELGDELSRVPGQRRDTPGNEKWSGRWESNPRLKLGKLGYYHYTTPAPVLDSSRLSEDQANAKSGSNERKPVGPPVPTAREIAPA